MCCKRSLGNSNSYFHEMRFMYESCRSHGMVSWNRFATIQYRPLLEILRNPCYVITSQWDNKCSCTYVYGCLLMWFAGFFCICLCACVRACVSECVRACVCVCVCICVLASVNACLQIPTSNQHNNSQSIDHGLVEINITNVTLHCRETIFQIIHEHTQNSINAIMSTICLSCS